LYERLLSTAGNFEQALYKSSEIIIFNLEDPAEGHQAIPLAGGKE
jgi:hypothetical protein